MPWAAIRYHLSCIFTFEVILRNELCVNNILVLEYVGEEGEVITVNVVGTQQFIMVLSFTSAVNQSSMVILVKSPF